MATIKISEMTDALILQDEDYIPILQADLNKKVTVELLRDYNKLHNKPTLNNITIEKDKNIKDYNIVKENQGIKVNDDNQTLELETLGSIEIENRVDVNKAITIKTADKTAKETAHQTMSKEYRPNDQEHLSEGENQPVSYKAVKEYVDTLESKVDENERDIEAKHTALENKVDENERDIENKHTVLDNKVDENERDIEDKVQKLDEKTSAKDSELEELINTNKEDVDAQIADLENKKLDKNQGTENIGKAMIVNEEGNLVPGKNFYTKEEVDYLLDDKMDKPYTSIEITDNAATITDSLEGNFKIDKIKGNTYQKVETDIVPTPSRPVPINSRKVLANGEYVELRSLKETGNLFDINFIKLWDNYSNSMTILDDGTVKVTNNDATLLPLKTKSITIPESADYTIKYDFETISGGANSGWISLVNMSNDNPKIFSTSGKTLHLDAGDYYVRFYRGQGATDVENNIVQYSNIVLVKGTSAPSTYVAPTIRDYKIVDHTSKTSKIVRNVHNVSFNKNSAWSRVGSDETGYRFTVIEKQPLKIENYLEVNNGFSNMSNNVKNFVVNDNKSGSGWYCTLNLYAIKVDGLQMGSLDDFKQLLGDNEIIFQCQLATPVEEEIAYSADDTSEVGLSWQDTTSPSPDIPSEIYEVEELNIKTVGKNLLDENKLRDTNNYDKTLSVNGFWEYVMKLKPNTNYTISRKNTAGYQQGAYIKVNNVLHGYATEAKWFVADHSKSENKQSVNITTKDDGTLVLFFNNKIETIIAALEMVEYLQIEEGAEATHYEPYQETSIQHTLSKPVRQIDGISDNISIVENKIDRKTLKIDITTLPLWVKGSDLYDKENTTARYGSYEENRNMVQFSGVSPMLKNPKIAIWQIDVESFTTNAGYQIHLSINNDRLSISKDDTSEKRTNKFVNYINSLKGTGKEFIYVPLSVATEEPLEDELVQKLKSLKTFSPVTHVFIEGVVKPILNAQYPKDIAVAQAQLEQKVLLISETLKTTQANLLLQGGND